MNSLLRLLEDWNAYQDYLWFLALLAWSGVIAAEFRRGERGRFGVQRGWLVALALGGALGALIELALLAQRLVSPYTKLDAAMGAAQALGTAALAWQAARGARHPAAWRAIACALLAGLGAARIFQPVAGGLGLALVQAGALLAILRRTPEALPRLTAVLLALGPVVATHGPWAYALHHGRKITDWSHFALPAAMLGLVAGAMLSAAGWRRRLRETVPHLAPGDALDRDLRRAGAWLTAWLVVGVLLAIWYGRVARRAFEENLLRRAETCVLALNPQTVASALVPELRITQLREARYSDGREVLVATVPHSRASVYKDLRAQLARVRQENPDFAYLYILVERDGLMLVLNSVPRGDEAVTHVIHHAATDSDHARAAAAKSYLEGPTRTKWLSSFSAKAPVFHPETHALIGWLVADVQAAAWMSAFVQARLQTMALVGAGVGLWVLAVAYRLRRETRDIAERKAAEAAAADRMKSAFLAKVSHELRTPIQSVLGYGELLDTAPLAEPHRSFLHALRSHGGVMLRLVNDLIDLGALQSGAFRLETSPVELAALVRECAAALQPAATEKGLAFHLHVAPDTPRWVQADSIRLRQILLNVLTNAVKFTRQGEVRCEVRRDADGGIAFVVSDTGPGIPVAQRARLFQPFARLDPAAGGGSGLGLALVQGLCGAMGGTIALAPDAAVGATFVVQLPLAACPPTLEAAPAVAAHAPRLTGLRVLLAEDNRLVRDLLLAFLREKGAVVSVAHDGPAALSLAREQAIDVLLLDIALPGLDGIQVAEQLRRAGPQRLRIVGLSAHASKEDEARARRAGMDEFLIKPVRLAELAAVIAPRSPAHAPALAADDLPDAEGMNASLRAALSAQFAAETPRVLEELRLAVIRGDWPALRQRAHYLKNSADVLGLAPMQAACRRACELDDGSAAVSAAALVDAIVASIPPSLFVLAAAPPADPP